MDMQTSAIDLRGLSFSFGSRAVLTGIDLRVPSGTIFGVVGPEGAGKSVLLLLLAGRLRPASGKGTVLGRPLGDRLLARRVAWIPEAPAFGRFATREGLLRKASRRSRGRAADHSAAVDALLLGPQPRRLAEASAGYRQRLALAAALSAGVELVVIDEPFTAQDRAGREAMSAAFDSVRGQGGTVVFAGRRLGAYEARSGELAVLNAGSIVAQGEPSTLAGPACMVEIEVEEMNEQGMAALRQLCPKLKMAGMPPRRLTAFLAPGSDTPPLAEALVSAGVRLRALTPRAETPEEALERLTHR